MVLFFYQNKPNLHNQHKLAERNLVLLKQKGPMSFLQDNQIFYLYKVN